MTVSGYSTVPTDYTLNFPNYLGISTVAKTLKAIIGREVFSKQLNFKAQPETS